MSRLLLMTASLGPSGEVLPALGLLAHHVRVLPAEASALLNAPKSDALLIDGRRDLAAHPGPDPPDPPDRRRSARSS